MTRDTIVPEPAAGATPPDAPLPPDIAAILATHRDEPGALLPILHDIQHAHGFIADALVPAIARALNLSRAEVHGVISYYADFHARPTGRHRVQVCRAESCRSVGGEELLAHAARTLDCAPHATRDDGAVTLEPVYCLGMCALSPAVRIDEHVHARMTPARFDALVRTLA